MKGNSLKGEVAEKLVLTFYKLPQTVIMGTISNDIVDFKHLLGLIIGKHRVFSEYNNNRTPIYHFSYDILCQLRDYTDGYSYEVRREVSRDLITTNLQSMDSVEGLMKQLALMVIERPL